VDHQSTRQTIVNPVSPKLLSRDVPLPNIMVWTPAPAIAPVASNHPLLQFPLAPPPVVPPIEQPAQRKLNALEFPVQPQVVAPPQTPANRNLAAVQLPVEPQSAVPPSQSAAQRRLGDINLAMNAPAVDAPKLPVPEQQAANGQQPAQSAPAPAPIPPAEPVTQGTGKSQAREMGQLLVANVQPVAPAGPVTVPEGNRLGEFAAGPTGRPDASGRPEIAAGDNDSPGGSKDGGNSLPSNVFIAAPPTKIAGGVVVSAPVLPPTPSAKPDTHDTGGRGIPGPEKIETQVFGDRKYYSMALNMPNLASASGSSWIIRFAEMNPPPGSAGDGVSAPVALSKVDPAYPASLIRDRIEGVVILYAVIHSDGSVGDIKVLQGVDDTLDENARDALQKWHFRPGTKNGAPVDLEAVIKIPFRAPKRVF
jgi:TonB family protein